MKISVRSTAALVAHVLAPMWWLDTVTDMVFEELIAFKVRQMRERSALSS